MSILIKPIVTEKVSSFNEAGQYGFVVSKDANKIQIKNAIESTYGVTVERVNTMVYPGKLKSRFTKSGVIEGKSASYKKAIVKVADGDVIDFYSAV
ncbi:MAG: 50S ribosomal protein L23 [Bacteroidota bacterium]